MLLFDKVLKAIILMTPVAFLSINLSCAASHGRKDIDAVRKTKTELDTINNARSDVDTIFGKYYEISKDPKQWIELTMIPDTFYLKNLQEGRVKVALSENHPWASTEHYVTVQRWQGGNWVEVKAPERQVRNSTLQIFQESTQFEHPFSLPVYFQENELVTGKYRILKDVNLYEVGGQEIILSTEFFIK